MRLTDQCLNRNVDSPDVSIKLGRQWLLRNSLASPQDQSAQSFSLSSPVPTQEQYELVHKAIAQLFEKQLQLLESSADAQIHDGTVRRRQDVAE